MNTQELKEKLDALYETFSMEHAGKSKAAHGRARKAVLLTGHYKDCFDAGYRPVGHGQLELVLDIGKASQAAKNYIGFLASRVFDG